MDGKFRGQKNHFSQRVHYNKKMTYSIKFNLLIIIYYKKKYLKLLGLLKKIARCLYFNKKFENSPRETSFSLNYCSLFFKNLP